MTGPDMPRRRIAALWQLRRAGATPWLILAAGWALFFVYAHPGYLSPDSIEQLAQGRSGVYGDWHPPMMAWLWGRLDAIVAGPLLMLVAQSGALLLGLYGVLRRALAPWKAALCAAAILLFPPVMTTMAVIWKDSQMAGYLAAGAACLLARRRWPRLVGCGLLVLATAQRVNAPAATLPLVVALFEWRDGLRGWKRYALALAVWLAIAAAAFAINRGLAHHKNYTWANAIALHDIAGTLTYSRKYSDDELRQILAGTHLRTTTDIQRALRRNYYAYNFYDINHGEDRVFEPFVAPEHVEPVGRAWRILVVDHPLSYLIHRALVFRAVLSLDPRVPVWAAVWDGYPPGDSVYWERIDFHDHHTAWQGWWIRTLMNIQHKTWMFRVYIYFVVALLVLPMCRRSRLELALLASGLLCELSLFVGAPTPDFRYSHWLVTAVTVACVLAFVRRYRAGRQPRAPDPAR